MPLVSPRTAKWLHAVWRVGLRYLYAPVKVASVVDEEEIKVRGGNALSLTNLPARISRFLFPNVPEHHPLYRKLQLAKSQSIWGRYWDVFMILVSLYACSLYVAEQYDASYDNVQLYGMSEIVVTQFFAVDFLYNLAAAPVWLAYMTAPWTLVDMLTIVPVYISLGLSQQRKVVNLSVLRFVRILRLVRILRMFKLLNGMSGVRRQLITLTLTLLSLLFMAAGIMQFMENDVRQLLDFDCLFINANTNWLPSCDPNMPASESCDCVSNKCQVYYSYYDPPDSPSSVRCQRLTFLSAFYYILVTAATIGYGDITPSSEVSRAVVIFIIFTTMTVIPVQVNTLTTLLSMTSQYRQPYVKASDEHVIICGYVQDWRKLEDFLKEILHPDRSSSGGAADDDLHVVILSPLEPSEDLKSLFLKNYFDGRVTYLVGSALNMSDLQRVRADTASAMFFLCNPEIHESASKLDDAAIVLRTLSVSNFNPKVSCFVQLLKSEDRDILKGVSLDFVLCLDELKTIVQARNCLCPGLSTLVENMFHTFGQSLKEQVGSRSYLSDKPEWQRNYIKGASKELYSVPLSLAFVEACSFEWPLVAEGIFLMFDCIVVGAYNSQTGDVLVNPSRADLKKYRYMSKFFENYDGVIVLADERSQVSRIEAGVNDRLQIQKCIKKICIAEDYFAIRRALPNKFREGSKFVRNKVTVREITRIVKGFGKQIPLEEVSDQHQKKPEAAKDQSTPTRADEGFMGFLKDKIKFGALKTASAIQMLGGHHSNHQRHTLADEINERRREGTWAEDEDEEMGFGDGGSPEESKMFDPNGAGRARSPSPASERPGSRMSRIGGGLYSNNGFDSAKIVDAGALRRHIVVFGHISNMYHFVSELRRPVLVKQDLHPIVIVSEELPPAWESIVQEFDDVFHLQGTMAHLATFNRTNIKQASAIILLSGRDNVTKVEEEYLDADTLFMYMKLEKHIPRDVFFGVELTCASNMAVLNSSAIRQVAESNKAAAVVAQAATANAALSALNQLTAEPALHEFKCRVDFFGKDVTSLRGSFSNHKTLVVAVEATASGTSKSSSGGPASVSAAVDQNVSLGVVQKPNADGDSIVAAKASAPTATVSTAQLPPLIDDTYWTIDETINVLPVFASGNAYVPVSFNSLLAQAFYDSFVPRICETLICGGTNQTMRQIAVPNPFVGSFFVDLYRTLLSRYITALALYRGPSPDEGNILPYVLTSPPAELVLRSNDRVFVFGTPKDVDECLEKLDIISLNDRELSLRHPIAVLLAEAKTGLSGGADSSPSKVAPTTKPPTPNPTSPSARQQTTTLSRRGSTGLIVIPANIASTFEV